MLKSHMISQFDLFIICSYLPSGAPITCKARAIRLVYIYIYRGVIFTLPLFTLILPKSSISHLFHTYTPILHLHSTFSHLHFSHLLKRSVSVKKKRMKITLQYICIYIYIITFTYTVKFGL